MADVDNLNFSVLINDKDFDAKCQKMEERAQRFNTTIAKAFEIEGMKDAIASMTEYKAVIGELQKMLKEQTVSATKAGERIAQLRSEIASMQRAVASERELAREAEKVTRERERQASATRNVTAETKRLGAETGKVTQYVNQFKNILGGATSIYAIKSILSNMIQITGEFELQRTTLRAILQDANKADVIFEKIKGLALVSPFNFKDLISYTKQLSAFSVPANELYDTTKMLADLSAGLGVSVERLILAYGQVRSAAFLRGQEVRQFTEAGVPLLEALKNEFAALGEEGITVGQVFDKISNRQVSFEMVKKVLTDMTSEGGKFYKMQEVQSETLKGKLSNLGDAFQMMYNEIGSSQSDLLKGGIDGLRKLMDNWEQVGKDIMSLVAAFGVYKATLAIVGIQQAALVRGMTTLGYASLKLEANLKKLFAVFTKNPYALIAAGAAAAAFAIYKMVTAQSALDKSYKSIEESHSKYVAELENEKAKLGTSLAKLKELKEGTEEYDRLKNRILLTYDAYLTKQDKEAISTRGLADSYDILAEAIANANKEKYREQESNNIQSQMEDMLGGLDEQIKKSLKKIDVSEYYSQFVMSILKGESAIEDIPDDKIRGRLKGLLYAEDITGAPSNLDSWKKWYENILEFYTKANKELDNAFSFTKVKQEEATIELNKFQKTVQETLTKFGKNKDYQWWADTEKNTDYYEYLKKIREEWKGIGEKIKDAGNTQDANLPTLKEEQKILEGIAKALGVEINPQKEKATTKKEENPYKSEIDALKKQYDLIKQMQSSYELLSKAGFADDAIGRFFKQTLNFSDFDFASLVNKSLSFDGAIKGGLEFEQQTKLITDALRQMGEEGVKAAENIEQSVKKVDLGEETRKFVELKKRMDEFNKSMKEWMGEDFNLIGEGIILDISRIATELNSKTEEIKRRADEMRTKYSEIGKDTDAEKALGGDVESILKMQDRYGTEVWANYVKHGSAAIDDLEKKEIAAAKRVSQEKVNDLAKKYGGEIIGDNSDIKTKRYGNLSIGQISKSIEALNDLLSKTEGELENILPEDLVKQIQEAGLSLTEFVEAYQKYLQNIKKDNEVELFKKVTKSAKETIGYVSSLSQSLARLGNATGNNGLVVAADALDRMKELSDIVLGELEKMAGVLSDVGDAAADMAKEAADAAKNIMNSASVITMIVKIVIFAIKTVIDVIAKSREQDAIRNQKLQEAYKENIKLLQEYRHELSLTDNVSSVFGDNLLKKIQNANVEISALKDKMKKYVEGMYEYNGNIVAKELFGGISPNIEWDFSTGEVFQNRAQTLMEGATNVLNNYNKAMGTSLSLFDEFGGINYDALQVVKNEFEASDLWNSDLEALLEYSKEYKETIEELEKSVAEISGQWAAELTDNLIESFIATGDAISNADKALKSFGNTFLKTIIQSYLLDKVFKNYKTKFTEILASNTSSADKMKQFDLTLQQMQNDLSIERDSINALLEAAKGYGWLDSSDDTLKGSIQGITEETANRLANLINGMYAEMFRQGAIFTNIDLNVMSIYNILSVSNDKYLDYLSQIAGNTYDTANHTQTIVTKMENVLIRMDDVMASSGGTGGSGIKVYLQS